MTGGFITRYVMLLSSVSLSRKTLGPELGNVYQRIIRRFVGTSHPYFMILTWTKCLPSYFVVELFENRIYRYHHLELVHNTKHYMITHEKDKVDYKIRHLLPSP